MVPLFLTFFCGLRGGGALGESVTCPQKGAEANCSAVPGKCDACESAVDRPILCPLKDPAPVIRLNELADSSVNFIVRPWSKTGDYWTVYWEVTAAVKRKFDAAGISIPYPQQDVHIHQVGA